MDSAKKIEQIEGGAKELPYMTHEELNELIRNQKELVLSKPEIEYLHLRRRRMSMEMKSPENGIEPEKLLQTYKCNNPYPYKVMIIGDEEVSGKQELFQIFALSDLIHKGTKKLGVDQAPPADIQTKVLEVNDPIDGSKKNYCIQMWLPFCSEDYTQVRPLYYSQTDVFIVVFSVKDKTSFEYASKVYLPEVKRFIESSSKDAPILLIGNHSESRSDKTMSTQLVPSQDAIQLAQSSGVSKYIEIFSENLFHVHELFQQAVFAINNSRKTCNIPVEQQVLEHYQETEYFKSVLGVPDPDGTFDQLERTFALNHSEGVEFFVTLDGSDPSKSSQKYTGPIKLTKNTKTVKVIGNERCKFSSSISRFSVPEQTAPAEAYFDIFTKAFHVVTRPNTVYYVTTDGSRPSIKSFMYEEPGIFFDDQKPNACFGVTVRLPEVVKVIAIEKNKFRSKVSLFKPFEVLPSPTVHYSPLDNMLRVETLPGIVYKYSLDGSIPTYDSMTYTAPVMLPRDLKAKVIKVAAFPRISFPSKVVEVVRGKSKRDITIKCYIGYSAESDLSKSPISNGNFVIKMNKTAITRSHSPPQLSLSTIAATGSPLAQKMQPLTPPSPTRINIPVQPQKTPQSPQLVKPQKSIKTSITHREQEAAIHRKVIFKKSPARTPPRQKTQQFKVNAGHPTSPQNPKNDVVVTCKAESTNVEFEFDKFVYLARIIVKTPGGAKGPTGYECFAVDEETTDITPLGKGQLKDIAGEQIMTLNEHYRKPCKKLLCHFKMAEGQSSFKILDMKVDCKTA